MVFPHSEANEGIKIDRAKASIEYTNSMANWKMAVISGYFVKALYVAG